MAESAFEAALHPNARRLLALLSEEDQGAIESVIRAIEADPYPDESVKRLVSAEPYFQAVYRHPRWWVLYRLLEPGHLLIEAISPSLSPPDDI